MPEVKECKSFGRGFSHRLNINLIATKIKTKNFALQIGEIDSSKYLFTIEEDVI